MSQKLQILQHLKKHGQINPLMALERYGCMRLAARIMELRDSGVKIHKEMKRGHNDKIYAVYTLGGK